jgi:hypothetical protein
MLSVAGNSLGPRGGTLGYAFKWLASVRFRSSRASERPLFPGLSKIDHAELAKPFMVAPWHQIRQH